jgi:streptogramin lyase
LSSPHQVAVDASGNVYIADLGNDRVLKETLTGSSYTESIVASVGLNDPAGVAVDGSGNVYVVDSLNDRVLKETPSGGSYTQSVVPTTGLNDPLAIAVDTNGDLFITDSGNGDVVEEALSGGSYSQRFLFGGALWPDGVAVDGSGNVYVTDTDDSRVLKLTPLGGGYTWSTIGSGFYQPHGIAVDGSGNVYIADSTDSIFKETLSAGSYTQSVVESGLSEPQALALDASGNLYFNDPINGRVLKLALSGANYGPVNVGSSSSTISLVFTFGTGGSIGAPVVVTQGATGLDFTDAGTGSCTTNGTTILYAAGNSCTVDVTFRPGAPGARHGAAELTDSSGNVIATGYVQGTGVGPLANFLPGMQSTLSLSNVVNPSAISVGAAGSLYIVDLAVSGSPTNKVVKETWTGNGYVQTTVASSGFVLPRATAVDGIGNVFIGDQDAHEVLEETLSGGVYSEIVPFPNMSNVESVAVDGSGNVYIASDALGVVKETFLGAALGYAQSTIAGSVFASGLAVDGSGNVYAVDRLNNRVLKETSSNGSYTQSLVVDGLDNAVGVAVDASGNVYIVNEIEDGQVLKETPSSAGYTQSTVASGLTLASGIAVDGSGNIYVTIGPDDGSNNGVLKIDVVDPPSLSFATTGYGGTSADSPRTVTVENDGNAALSFAVPTSGDNPSIVPGFTWNSTGASACPLVASGSSAAGTLAAGASCALAVSFQPTALGNLSGSLVLTDNNLNAVSPDYATQSIALSGTGAQATPSNVLTSSAAAAYVSNPVIFTATVSSSGGTPTGTVSFYDGTTLLGQEMLSAGVATYTTSALASGAHSITAVYSGDVDFTAATSAALAETIEDFTLGSSGGATTPSQTVSAGGQAVYTLTIDPPSGTTFAGLITFTVTGLPAGATATFSPATVAAGAGATNVTMTVSVPSQSAMRQTERPFGGGTLPVALGLILLPFAGRLRKGSRLMKQICCLTVLVLGAALLAGLTGCGGGSGSTPGSASESYTLTITATSGSLSHTMTVNLTVE